eukprot:1075898-Amphidinium_carterae.1
MVARANRNRELRGRWSFSRPGATEPQQPQQFNALKLNTLLVEKPSFTLSSFSPSVLKLKVDSGAGASVVPTGACTEPVLSDAMTGRTYFTANGEKVYDKG